MKKIGFITNNKRDINFEKTKELLKISEECGFETFVLENSENLHTKDECFCENIFKTCDFLAVLGGDGTILNTARRAVKYDLPIIGINIGNLGYLTDASGDNAVNSIQNIAFGKYKIEKRMMLEAKIDGKDNKELVALNDVCVTRGASLKLSRSRLFVNGEFIDNYSADGLIVCTPTGSTAYNLSAGGPILKPDSEIMAVTPICPHSLHMRSLVLSATDEIKIVISERDDTDMILSLDGINVLNLNGGEIINIKKSKYYLKLIKTNDLGFYDILRMKMME